MEKESVIEVLYSIKQQFEISIDEAVGEYADSDAMESLSENNKCVEALNIAIEMLEE